MAIRQTQWTATAAGSAGSSTGTGNSPDTVEGVILAVNVRRIRKVAFTSGSEKPQVGDTLTGATSAATARVYAVVLTSGQWALGDAAGTLWLTDQTGTFQSENLNNSTSGTNNVATIGADTTGPATSIDLTIQEANEWPPLPVLTLANVTADGWYYPRLTLHSVADGSAVVGPVDYQSTADVLKLSLSGANNADSLLVTVRWDDERR